MAKIISVTVPEGTTYDIGAKYDIDGNEINSTYVKVSQKGAASGVAELDANGKVPSPQLPSLVGTAYEYDDTSLTLEFNEETEFDTSFSPISDLEIDQIMSN